jgi:hypothetical protein
LYKSYELIAVITGDIIKSRDVNSRTWQPKLKKWLAHKIVDTRKWQIYRGDSFQLEVPVEDALDIAISIKALIKSIDVINVRMSIGIGEKNYDGKKVIESNGSAFINSGEGFNNLKFTTFIIKSNIPEIDDYFNSILRLISFISDHWKEVTAETILVALANKDIKQKDLAVQLKKSNTTISKSLKRGGYDEILTAINLYRKRILLCLN